MATFDYEVCIAVRDELGSQLSEPAMATLWTQPGGLNGLLEIHADDTKLIFVDSFLRGRAEMIAELQARYEQFKADKNREEVFALVRREAMASNGGHPRRRVMCVLHHLDREAKDDKSHAVVMVALARLSEAITRVDALVLHFARIRAGAAANVSPTHLETTGPPEDRRVIRLPRRTGRSSDSSCSSAS